MLGLTLWRRRMRGYGLMIALNWIACSTLGYQNFPAIDLLTATVFAMFLFRRKTRVGYVLIGLTGAMLACHAVFWTLYDLGIYWATYQTALDGLFVVALLTASIDGGRRIYDLVSDWGVRRLLPRRFAAAWTREKA